MLKKKMRVTENGCVDCGLPCIGNSCPNRNVTTLYCDDCGCEEEKLYEFEGLELCEVCVLNHLSVVK